MPHSLRAQLRGLRYKRILEEKDYKRLCKALDNENVLEQIRAEIADLDDAEYEFEGYYKAVNDALQIIDKYKGE